jgi:hypothetical protein
MYVNARIAATDLKLLIATPHCPYIVMMRILMIWKRKLMLFKTLELHI